MKHDRILCTYRSAFSLAPQVCWQKPGLSLDQALDSFTPALPAEFRAQGTICLNGHPVPRDAWALVRPKPPQPGRPIELSFHLPPRGGGEGGGKKIFAFIASIALSLATGWVLSGGLAKSFGLSAFTAGSTAAYAVFHTAVELILIVPVVILWVIIFRNCTHRWLGVLTCLGLVYLGVSLGNILWTWTQEAQWVAFMGDIVTEIGATALLLLAAAAGR